MGTDPSRGAGHGHPTMHVFVLNPGGAPLTVLAGAEAAATRVFHRAGIETTWRHASDGREDPDVAPRGSGIRHHRQSHVREDGSTRPMPPVSGFRAFRDAEPTIVGAFRMPDGTSEIVLQCTSASSSGFVSVVVRLILLTCNLRLNGATGSADVLPVRIANVRWVVCATDWQSRETRSVEGGVQISFFESVVCGWLTGEDSNGRTALRDSRTAPRQWHVVLHEA